jgi:hypothetical protein
MSQASFFKSRKCECDDYTQLGVTFAILEPTQTCTKELVFVESTR